MQLKAIYVYVHVGSRIRDAELCSDEVEETLAQLDVTLRSEVIDEVLYRNHQKQLKLMNAMKFNMQDYARR